MVNKWFHNILGVLTPSHQVYKDYIQMFRRIRRITHNDKAIRSEKYGLQFIGSIEKEMSCESSVGS